MSSRLQQIVELVESIDSPAEPVETWLYAPLVGSDGPDILEGTVSRWGAPWTSVRVITGAATMR